MKKLLISILIILLLIFGYFAFAKGIKAFGINSIGFIKEKNNVLESDFTRRCYRQIKSE